MHNCETDFVSDAKTSGPLGGKILATDFATLSAFADF
jgi:hypothetical protein